MDCRRAAGESRTKVQQAAFWERLGTELIKVVPLCGTLLGQFGRIYHPRAAVGNAFMTVLCEELEKETVANGLNQRNLNQSGD